MKNLLKGTSFSFCEGVMTLDRISPTESYCARSLFSDLGSAILMQKYSDSQIKSEN